VNWAIAGVTLLVAAGLNRLRGHGISGSRVYASIGMGILAGILFFDWPPALAVATAFLFWAAFSWGRWFDLERMPDGWNRDPDELSTFDMLVEKVSFGSDHMALFVRHVVGILPLGVLLGYWCGWEWLAVIPVFAALVVAAYEIAWQVSETWAIEIAEVLTGLVWGALLLAVYFLCDHHFRGIGWVIAEMSKA
jgi:hypothetical protein